MIPTEAVEAAWDAMPKDAYVDTPEQVRAMLEAAAPHMLAGHEDTLAAIIVAIDPIERASGDEVERWRAFECVQRIRAILDTP